MLCRTLLLLLSVFCAVSPARAAFWDVEPVCEDSFLSGDASLAVSPASVPSISYTTDGTLYLATRGAEEWTPTSVADVGYMGGWSSVAFSPAGQPCIAYVDASGESAYLKYAYKSGLTWVFETIDTVGWMPDHVSLTFTPLGQACVAYCISSGTYPNLTYTVRFARRIASGTWNTLSISQVGFATAPAAVVSPQNVSYVAFCDSNTGELRVASSAAGGPWQTQIVDGAENSPAIAYPAISLSPDGSPVLAYVINSETSAALVFARKVGGEWQRETATTLARQATYNCAVCINAEGMPFIAYHDPATATLKNAWKHGGVWFTETVDEAEGAGSKPSLKLDSIGNIDAAYVQGGLDQSVKFAWAIAPTSAQEAKAGSEGATVQVSGVIVSSATDEVSQRIYAQNADRTCGIALYYPGTPPTLLRGDVLDVQGTLSTVNGERVISSALLSDPGTLDEPVPLGMPGRTLGGGDFRYDGASPIKGQRGVTGGSGLNNVGLLVTTWGRMLYDGPHDFRIDDGSGVLVRCKTPASVAVNPLWQIVNVTGISSCQVEGSDLVRVLRVRAAEDIVQVL